MHSNLAIAEELLRISDYLEPMVPLHQIRCDLLQLLRGGPGQDKKTPAMRIGLARGPIAPEDILYFEPAAPAGQRRRAPRKDPVAAHETPVNP